MIGVGLLYATANLSSVIMHVFSIRSGFAYRVDQTDDLAYLKAADLNNVDGLLYHIPLAVSGVVSAVIFFFPDRVGYAISFLALLCSASLYWGWNSWSLEMRGSESLSYMISEQHPIGGSVVTTGLLILLWLLLIYETAVLVKVVFFWRRS
jgi:hypothetical protein